MNKITIPLKSNDLYGITRKLGLMHSKFRMQHSNLKNNLYRLHVIDDPVCVCSTTLK